MLKQSFRMKKITIKKTIVLLMVVGFLLSSLAVVAVAPPCGPWDHHDHD